jgi:hypothetical protein
MKKNITITFFINLGVFVWSLSAYAQVQTERDILLGKGVNLIYK